MPTSPHAARERRKLAKLHGDAKEEAPSSELRSSELPLLSMAMK